MPRKPLPSTFICYHCDSNQTSKAGFTKNKKQRYYCRSCRRFSRENLEVRTGGTSNPGWQPKSFPSKSRLALELQAIAQRIGRTPTTTDIREISKEGCAFSLNTYYELFGSFLEAVKKAGLKARYHQDFDKENLLGELRALRAKLKRPLIGKDVAAARKKGRVSSLYHFQRAFGSVPQAIAAADAGRKKYSREEMIKILRRIDSQLDRPVLVSDIDKLFHSGRGPSHRAIEREFGGIAKARLAAGIRNVYRKEGSATRNWQKYTPEELINQLQALGKRLGRKPSDRDINRASREGFCASSVTFVRMFGSLVKAYRKAGFEKVKPRSYTDKEILSAFEKLAKEKGGMPTYHELVAASKAGKCPAPGTILRRVGRLRDLNFRFQFDR